jgi:flagellar motor switch protein FliG
MSADSNLQSLGGAEKAALLIMALGEDGASQIFAMMDESEIRAVSHQMAKLGPADDRTVAALLADFAEQLGAGGKVVGNCDNTERLLSKVLDPRLVNDIMSEIRAPEARSLWDRIALVEVKDLAEFLQNEYPQTVALVLSKLPPARSAAVLSLMQDEVAMEAASRLLKLESVRGDVLADIERGLEDSFLTRAAGGAGAAGRDPHEQMAAILNRMDAEREARFLAELAARDESAAERIRALMFTFEDLTRLDPASLQTLIGAIDRDRLCLALKGASARLRSAFFANMSERAAGMMQEDMQSLGPVRLRDVEAAQAELIDEAKGLAAAGEIALADERNDDKLVY